MALKLSTKLRNQLLGGEDLRRIFEDGVLKIYSGSAPSSADDIVSGVLLATITKASGTVSASEVSTHQEALLAIGSHASGETFTLIVNGVSYTYTNTPDLDAIPIAAAFAKYIDANCPDVEAFASGTINVYVRSKYKGVAVTWSIAGTGTINSTTGAQALADSVANSLADTIRFAAPASGVIAKETAVWSGVAVATGVAGYFRLINSADDGSADGSNLLYPRLQGSVGVSGTEMTMSNTTITSGATQTVDSASITMPAS